MINLDNPDELLEFTVDQIFGIVSESAEIESEGYRMGSYISSIDTGSIKEELILFAKKYNELIESNPELFI